VGEEDEGSPPGEEVAEGGEAFQDPGLVLDLPVLDGDVVVTRTRLPLGSRSKRVRI